MMNFGRNLKYWRKKRRMTMQDLADRLGMSRPGIHHWESGYTQPSLERLVMLSDILGVSTDTLLKGERYDDAQNPV